MTARPPEMNETRFVTSVASYAGQSVEHYKHVASLGPVAMYGVTGESNVTLARCRQLTQIVHAPQNWKVLMLIDDDVFFRDRTDAAQLIEDAFLSNRPTAALYPDITGSVKYRLAEGQEGGRLLTGIGALAIPRERFFELAGRTLQVKSEYGDLGLFCQSGSSACGQFWWSEDYWLCYKLGGVELGRVHVAHRKNRMLRMSEEAFRGVRAELLEQRRQGET